MNTVESEPIISPMNLKKEFPLNVSQLEFIEKSRQQIRNILDGTDERLLLIMGPCSVHDIASAEHYAMKLAELREKICHIFFPVMRVYFEKPRTSLGWKGMMHDPHLDNSFDLHTGIRRTRDLLLRLAKRKVPAASEVLDPISANYFGDLLSWGCIGARTASSQIHRQVASGLSFPTAFKNNTEGSIHVALNGILRASNPDAYIGINHEGVASILHTPGNPYCHLVLRGSEKEPNYDSSSLHDALKQLEKKGLPKRLLIDCSHDNSRRDYNRQPLVFASVIKQVLSGTRAIKGCLLESHLKEGNQEIKPSHSLEYAVSITDSCMGWETTKAIIVEATKEISYAKKGAKQKYAMV